MFRLPNTPPDFKDDIIEITDYFENECLLSKSGHCSFRSIYNSVSMADDEIDVAGIEDSGDKFNNEQLDEICLEIEHRKLACGGNYPFELQKGGYQLSLIKPINTPITILYSFLLFATRLNMKDHRSHNGKDGALIFERISAQVAKCYLGNRAESMVFGTAESGTFKNKIDDLCIKIGEGEKFKSKNTAQPTEKDGKLDVVVWKNFSDGQPAKIIGFGQCKTGTHWENQITQLQPDAFCRSWFENMPAVIPLRLFFVSDSFPRNQWYSKATEAGIIFDRYRMMDYLPEHVESELFDEINLWVQGVRTFIIN